eukprot:TRINITY_DN4475_c3_g1_i1.p1 TRINITY_DN4475_c3_g1~~TRINITY_DN4475_c3_g1_i1.p1  ORF type:complete len:223 (-),score=36.94 TRINITY_DN4475_c3_g1_i1:34-633(-)
MSTGTDDPQLFGKPANALDDTGTSGSLKQFLQVHLEEEHRDLIFEFLKKQRCASVELLAALREEDFTPESAPDLLLGHRAALRKLVKIAGDVEAQTSVIGKSTRGRVGGNTCDGDDVDNENAPLTAVRRTMRPRGGAKGPMQFHQILILIAGCLIFLAATAYVTNIILKGPEVARAVAKGTLPTGPHGSKMPADQNNEG